MVPEFAFIFLVCVISLTISGLVAGRTKWDNVEQRYVRTPKHPSLDELPTFHYDPQPRNLRKAEQVLFDNWEERFAPFDPARKAVVRAPEAISPDQIHYESGSLNRFPTRHMADHDPSMGALDGGLYREYLRQSYQQPSLGTALGDERIDIGGTTVSRRVLEKEIQKRIQSAQYVEAQFLMDLRNRHDRRMH